MRISDEMERRGRLVEALVIGLDPVMDGFSGVIAEVYRHGGPGHPYHLTVRSLYTGEALYHSSHRLRSQALKALHEVPEMRVEEVGLEELEAALDELEEEG